MGTYLTIKAIEVTAKGNRPDIDQLVDEFIDWLVKFYEDDVEEDELKEIIDREEILEQVVDPVLKKITIDPIFVVANVGFEYVEDLYEQTGKAQFLDFLGEKGLIEIKNHDEAEIKISAYC